MYLQFPLFSLLYLLQIFSLQNFLAPLLQKYYLKVTSVLFFFVFFKISTLVCLNHGFHLSQWKSFCSNIISSFDYQFWYFQAEISLTVCPQCISNYSTSVLFLFFNISVILPHKIDLVVFLISQFFERVFVG